MNIHISFIASFISFVAQCKKTEAQYFTPIQQQTFLDK